MKLAHKKILLFAPDFFGYDIEIKYQLERMGAVVDLYDERPSSNALIKAVIRIKRELLWYLTERYFDRILIKNQNKNYDYIFVVKGEVINEKIMYKYKSVFTNAQFILYLYDSIDNYKSIKSCFKYFDKVYSFDRRDSKNYPEIQFRPLFFIEKFHTIYAQQNEGDFKYDILFVGTIHSDRWNFLDFVRKTSMEKGLRVYYYLYFPNRFIFYLRKCFVKGYSTLKASDVQFVPIKMDKIINLTRDSRSVIDIQHPKQTGLTMRTIEVLGSGRKLLTTNSEIQQYDFYSPENIQVIDRVTPEINSDFIYSPFETINDKLRYKYSLRGWIDEVFELNKN
jgi:hypothetical protein